MTANGQIMFQMAYCPVFVAFSQLRAENRYAYQQKNVAQFPEGGARAVSFFPSAIQYPA